MKYRALLLPYLFLASVVPVLASPLPSCPKAASSKNGNFLVLRDIQVEGAADHSGGKKIQQVSFQVLTKTDALNQANGFAAGATYWEFQVWDVILTEKNSHPLPYCAVPLVSDDGEFMVLLNQNAAAPGDSALWIYKRRYHPGDRMGDGPETSILVKSVTLGEIWLSDKFPKVIMVTDATPLWFERGSFSFSEDNRLLTHKTRWGNSVEIGLSGGTVARK